MTHSLDTPSHPWKASFCSKKAEGLRVFGVPGTPRESGPDD